MKDIKIQFALPQRFFGFIFIWLGGGAIYWMIESAPNDGTFTPTMESIWFIVKRLYVLIGIVFSSGAATLVINRYLKKGTSLVLFESSIRFPALQRMMLPFISKEVEIQFLKITSIELNYDRITKKPHDIKIESALGSYQIFKCDFVNKDDFDFLINFFKKKFPSSFRQLIW